MLLPTSFLAFIQAGTSAKGLALPTFRGHLPSSVNLQCNSLTDGQACLLDDSQFRQVDNDDWSQVSEMP